tara:strand:+ start:328 stop:726 length:399 start_codon:yes stop_codon:yes gene_type:complete
MNYQVSLLPQRMSYTHSPQMNNLNNYVPNNINKLETTYSALVPLPFKGEFDTDYIVGQGNNYRDPNLLGVVGHSPEQVAFYQRALPEYIPKFYPNIPLTRPQNQYMTEEGSIYANLYSPNTPIYLPQTVFNE